MRVNRQWVLKIRPDGMIKESNFEVVEKKVPAVMDNQILAKTLLLSFDPTQRIWAAVDSYLPAVALGEPMRAFGLGQVIESKSKRYRPGDLIAGIFSWQEYLHFDVNASTEGSLPSIIPPVFNQEIALALMLTGATAYFGMLDICKPKRGETVVVSGAAGATGSIAAQLAKIKGARVIGVAGGEEKCSWLKETLGLDGAIDYKNGNVYERIAELCPNGVNVFFDNVGGEILDACLANLAMNSRIALCGGISQYNEISSGAGMNKNLYPIKNISNVIPRRALIKGFIVLDYRDRLPEAMMMLDWWIKRKKLIQEIDLQEGFENIPSTFMRLFEHKNRGKQLLRLSQADLPLNKSAVGEFFFSIAERMTAWRRR